MLVFKQALNINGERRKRKMKKLLKLVHEVNLISVVGSGLQPCPAKYVFIFLLFLNFLFLLSITQFYEFFTHLFKCSH